MAKLTGNPIETVPEYQGKKMRLTVFAMFEGLGDHVNEHCALTGRRSWLYAGAGHGYEVEFQGKVYWLKKQSLRPV